MRRQPHKTIPWTGRKPGQEGGRCHESVEVTLRGPRGPLTGLLVAGLLLASCADSGRVSLTDPPDGAEGVDPAARIRVTFSDDVRASTVNSETFQVSGSRTGDVGGRFDVDRRVVTFTPTRAFLEGETVEVAVTERIRTTGGVPVAAFSFSFRIRGPGDEAPEPFELASHEPAAYANAAGPEAAIRLVFTTALNPYTITEETVVVRGRGGARIPVRFEDLFTSIGQVAAIPAQPLRAGERVWVTAAGSIRSAGGARFAGAAIPFRAATSPWDGTLRDGGALPVPCRAPILADLDGEGGVDAAALSLDGRGIAAFRGDEGAFDLLETIEVTEALAWLGSGDLDGDGTTDLVALAAGGRDLLVFAGRGAEGFGEAIRVPLASPGTSAAIGDGDLDGRLEAYVASPGAEGILVVEDEGDGLQVTDTLPAPGLSGPPRLEDIDLDLRPDLVYPAAGGAAVGLVLDLAGARRERRIDAPADLVGIDAGDADGDGIPDLAVTSREAGAAIRLGEGDGAFAEGVRVAGEPPHGPARFGDMTGDGVLDLVLPAGGDLLVFAGDGAGGFAEVAVFAGLGDAEDPPRVADLDGDGVLDVLVPSDPAPRVWLAGAGAEAPYRLAVATAEARPGDAGVALPVALESPQPIDGFTLVLAWDPAQLRIGALGVEGTATEAAGAELVIPTLQADAGHAILAVIADFLPPMEGRRIPALAGEPIAAATFTVRDGAPEGFAEVELRDGLGDPPSENALVRGGRTIRPELAPGGIEVLPGAPPGPLFVRGDANGDGAVDIADHAFLSQYLFAGGPAPPCLDAADADDDGRLALGDGIYILNYLSGDGPPPPPPFPEAGEDPTDDALGCGA